MLLHEVTLSNVLSFGSETTLGMKPLNVLIGPNGSGKSNFIEALGLLHAAPTDIRVPIREGGGVVDWLWRGDRRPSSARLEVVVDNPRGQQPLRYSIEFGASNGRFAWTACRAEDTWSSTKAGPVAVVHPKKTASALACLDSDGHPPEGQGIC